MLLPTSGILRAGARRSVARAATLSSRSANPNVSLRHRNINAAAAANGRFMSTTPSPGYVTNTNPNPPLGKQNSSKTTPTRVALIGARGYTGQALIELLNAHPYLDLCHVSSRELAGQELKGYTKKKIIYQNLNAEECAQLDVDAHVLALPNGVCKPYVDAIDQADKESGKKSVVVDLSADYRFDNSWVCAEGPCFLAVD